MLTSRLILLNIHIVAIDFLPARAGLAAFKFVSVARLLGRIGGQVATLRQAQRGKPNMRISSCACVAAVAVVLLAGVGGQASAQTPEQFYKGKTIDFVIGY